MKFSHALLVVAAAVLFSVSFAKGEKSDASSPVTFYNVRILNIESKNVVIAYPGDPNAQKITIWNLDGYRKLIQEGKLMDLTLRNVGAGWKIVGIQESSYKKDLASLLGK